jgi:hypothetical protein
MNRSLSRSLVVAATVLALTFACIPAASAQSSKAPAFKLPTSWLGTVLTLAAKLPILPGGQGSGYQDVQQKEKGDSTGTTGRITLHTGSCIDPDGNRVPCGSI